MKHRTVKRARNFPLYIAITTPLTRGLIDLDKLLLQLKFLHDAKIRHILLGGNTGEGNRLAFSERVRLLAAASKKFRGTISFNVSSTCLADTIDLIRSGIGMAQEFIFTLPVGAASAPARGMIDYVEAICRTFPQEKFYFYLHPSVGIASTYLQDVLTQVVESCPNLAGVKDSLPSSEVARFLRKVPFKRKRRFLVLTGDDTRIVRDFQDGLSDGIVSGAANPFPERMVLLKTALLKNDRRAVQKHAAFFSSWIEVIRLAHSSGSFIYGTQEIAAIKAALKLRLKVYPVAVMPPLAEIYCAVMHRQIAEIVRQAV